MALPPEERARRYRDRWDDQTIEEARVAAQQVDALQAASGTGEAVEAEAADSLHQKAPKNLLPGHLELLLLPGDPELLLLPDGLLKQWCVCVFGM